MQVVFQLITTLILALPDYLPPARLYRSAELKLADSHMSSMRVSLQSLSSLRGLGAAQEAAVHAHFRALFINKAKQISYSCNLFHTNAINHTPCTQPRWAPCEPLYKASALFEVWGPPERLLSPRSWVVVCLVVRALYLAFFPIPEKIRTCGPIN